MPYEVRAQKCTKSNGESGTHVVSKKGSKKKSSCHSSEQSAKDSIKARYASKNMEESIQEIKDYFRKQNDEDYLKFDDHPLSKIDSLMDPSKPAPWDHLNNDEDDEDVDIEIDERTKE